MKIRSLILILICLITRISAKAQSDTEFWFAAPDLQQAHGDRPIYLRIATSQKEAFVTIEIPSNPSFTPITRLIASNSSLTEDLTPYISQIENSIPNTVQQKGIHIVSSAKITCYYDIANSSNGDMFSLKGSNALGVKFTLPFQMNLKNRVTTGVSYTTDFIIVATENDTRVQIKASCDLTGQPNRNFEILLNKGETYTCSITSTLLSDKPGGTIVTSNKPIAITTKDDSLQYTSGGCYDTAGDQLIPDRMAGIQFVLLKGYFSGSGADYFYVFATESNTDIFINGSKVATLANPGDYFNGVLSAESAYIETSHPVHIFQISGFGCELGGAVIPTIKCTGSQQVNVTRASGTLDFYINVLAPASIINDFTLNGSNALIGASTFKPVPGNPQWYYARILVPSAIAGTGSNVKIENATGKFHVGVIHGGASSTTRFGYFSDFSTNTITFNKSSQSNIPLNNTDTVCYKGNFQINAKVLDALEYTWTGPNNYFSKDPFLSFTNFLIQDTGYYYIEAPIQGCGIAKDSLRLVMDKPIADFSFTTTGCEGDRVQFIPDPLNAVRWIWDFGNTSTLDTDFPLPSKQSYPLAGDYQVKLKIMSHLGCFSDDTLKTLKLSSIPHPAYEASPITCIQKDIIFKDLTPGLVVGNIVQWKWDFDNGLGEQNFQSGNDQTISYPTWGKKNVRLSVVSNTGCISSAFALPNLIVHPNPTPGFMIPEVCLDDANALFTDTTKSVDGNTTFSYQWNFNAGNPMINPGPTFSVANVSQQNPSVKYNAAGLYQVTLIVTGQGCIDSLTQNFTVNGANPTPAFDIIQNAPLCSNESIIIRNQSFVGIGDISRLEIYWDINNLSIKTIDETPTIGKNYSHLYPNFQAPASKPTTIRMVAYSGNAATCTKSIEQVARIEASPKIIFDPLPGICLESSPRQITEASISTLIPGNYIFSGPGVSSNGIFNPTNVGPGNYTIQSLFISDKGCRDSALQTIVVWPRPLAQFTFSETQCEKAPIDFQSKSLAQAGSLTQWNWNFGDGSPIQSIGNENPISHIFPTANSHNVSLSVTTSNGCTSLPTTQAIGVHPLPIPAFDLPKVCLPVGAALFNNHSAVSDNGSQPLQYIWDFGDPQNTTPSSSINGLHYYKQTGAFPVKLIATTAWGCKDSLTQTLRSIFPQPKANFKSLDSACLGTAIIFTDQSDGSGSTILSSHWDFGDGTQNNQLNTENNYQDIGTYNVAHYIVTNEGCYSDTVKKSIPIYDYPIVDAGADLYAFEDGTTPMNAKATGNAVLFLWTPATYLNNPDKLNPLIEFPTKDVVYTLKVTGRGACSRSDDVKVTVLHKPVIANTFTPNGDGYNEKWEIKNVENYPNCSVEVYTPQGQLVYRNNNYNNANGWDGKRNGIPLPTGTYYYVLNPRLGRNKMTGYVTILR